jgi:hypothetical protein
LAENQEYETNKPRETKMMTNSNIRRSLGGVLSLGLLLNQTTLGQSTNPPALHISKSSANAQAVLSWDSKTNEVYTILYSTNLTAGFLRAVTDFSNQGTNTIWSDTGTESGLGSRPSSADSGTPIRFYRLSVQGYTSNSFPATITFSNAANGILFSGLTNIFASATSPSNLISGKLSVDGNDVAFDSGGSYIFPLETRFYPNGTHRLSITVEDNGDSGSTGPDDPSVPAYGEESSASYATGNRTVTFSNFLSDVRLKYQGYRPELGQTQEIHGTWASPRNWRVDITPANDTNTIYRSFSGSGTSIGVLWNGLDSSSNQLDPQRVAYVIYDLGQASGMSASSVMAASSAAERFEPTELWALPKDGSGDPVPFDIYPPGIDTKNLVLFEATSSQVHPTRLLQEAQQVESFDTGGSCGLDDSGGGDPAEPFIVYSTYKTFGKFGMLYQGHHPYLSPANRPQRGPPYGQVTFASDHNPPWGKIKSVKRIASDLAVRFPISGYPLGFIYGDDSVSGDAFRKSSLGGSNIFNNVTIGLYAGHSAACKENIVALAHPQSYIPVYHTGTGSMDWVGMYDMDLGSSNLKWVAFFSCNMFRDDAYRANGSYSLMKNNEHLAINTSLHIMQGYATEMTVRHDMGLFWAVALVGPTTLTSDNTVLAAWRFVCLKTQPVESATEANVSRSAYWPECAGDHIYGYGSQTDPDLDHIQEELLEDDQMANTIH